MADFVLHPLLAGLKAELALGFQEATYDVAGHSWHMRTLTEEDEIWVSKFANSATLASFATSTRAPRLAATIQSIDNIPVAGMFAYPPDMDKDQVKALENNPISKRYWILDEFVKFLIKEIPPPALDVLWSKWLEMSNKRTEGMEKHLPNFSTRTQVGAPEVTSSPSAGSSPQTQP